MPNQRFRGLRALQNSSAGKTLVAQSDSMRAVLRAIAELRDGEEPVLIEGEPGSGRELVARLLHGTSSRGAQDMISIRAGGAPAEILRCPVGDDAHSAFESARQSTLLVRDVCELRRSSQRSLNKALGAELDTRVIATTDPGLAAAVDAGCFYEPLYRKLASNTIRVPPLRHRMEDIVPLMARFVTALARDMGRKRLTVSSLANDALLRYPWPGNVAEMKQIARRLVVRAKAGRVEAGDVDAVLPMLAQRAPLEDVSFEDLVRGKLGELLRKVDGYPLACLHEEVMNLVERPLLGLTMEHTGGNQLKAAEILGLSRNTLRKKLTEFGLVAVRPKLLRAKPRNGARKSERASGKPGRGRH